jgi:transcriptional regulator with XRE-family HTH domain
MRAGKRRRLEKAGWKLGSAKEFLGLTDEEEAVIDLKLALARAVREERSKRKLTQNQLGRLLGSSQSRMAKMEAGDPSVSIDLLVRSLLRMGASRRDLIRWLARPGRRRPNIQRVSRGRTRARSEHPSSNRSARSAETSATATAPDSRFS